MVGRRGFRACVLSLLLLSAPASQPLAEEAASSLEYALPDQSIWTTHTTSAGVPDNPLVKYAASLFAKAGLAYHVATYPSARLFNRLKDEPGVFSMLVESAAVRACCLVSSHPVAHTDLMAYRLEGAPALKGPEDLKGRHLILIRGYSYGELAAILKSPDSRLQIDLAATHDTGFAMLERGRGDYLLDYAGPATEVLMGHPMAHLNWQRLSRSEVYLVLSKTYPQAEELMKRLEAAAATLSKVEVLGKEMN